VMNVAANYDDVILAQHTGSVLNFITQLPRLEDDYLEVVWAVKRNFPPPVQNQKAHVDGNRIPERPNVVIAQVNASINKRINVLPIYNAR